MYVYVKGNGEGKEKKKCHAMEGGGGINRSTALSFPLLSFLPSRRRNPRVSE